MPSWIEKVITVFYFIKHRYFLRFRSRSDLEKWQRRRLKRFLSWVQKHSPFYRRLTAGVNLQNYPLMDKNKMMTNFSELNTVGIDRDEALQIAIKSEQERDFSPNLNGDTVGLSSGTSGHRGLFLASAFERAKYAGTVLGKVLPRGRVFRNNKIGLFLRANSNLYEAVGSRLIDFRFFDICKAMEPQIAQLNVFQPDILFAQPSVLRFLADKNNSGELSIQPLRIFSAAEVLEDIDRVHIGRAFSTQLQQIYQCTEGFLGITCEFGRMHLNEDLIAFEKEYLPGSSTKFQPILTDFSRSTQPIIKYRLNDVLTEAEGACPCGSVFTQIQNIDGRHDDTIYFPLARGAGYAPVWSDLIRNRILYSHTKIAEYRVFQCSSAQLDISLKVMGSQEEVQQAVLQQLAQLAESLNCRLPKVQFVDYEERADFSKKLRRIQGSALM
jgi:putative adenylate-forming enzyme